MAENNEKPVKKFVERTEPQGAKKIMRKVKEYGPGMRIMRKVKDYGPVHTAKETADALEKLNSMPRMAMEKGEPEQKTTQQWAMKRGEPQLMEPESPKQQWAMKRGEPQPMEPEGPTQQEPADDMEKYKEAAKQAEAKKTSPAEKGR